MFWRFGGYASISTLDTILDKPDVTVEELLDESDLIQELKQQNSKLVEFLRDEPVLKKLLDYVTAEEEPEVPKEKESEDASKTEEEGKTGGIPFFGRGNARSRSISLSKRNRSDDAETEHEKKEAQRKKYAYVACEVLSSEVWSITEAIMENREHLRQFWQYIHRPAPLDPLQAGYFTKVNEALLDKKTEEMLDFFKSLDGIVPAILQHVDCPMVMDLLLKIISLEKHEGGEGIVDWLQSQDLIPLLLDFLSPEHSSATQTSAGDFLKAIITISANATTQDQSVIGPNELTRQLVSDKCIKTLIDDMLRGGNPLTVGVGIIIEVIRKNNSDYDLDNQVGPEPKTSDPIFLGSLLRQFANHIPDFMHLVRSKGARKPDLKAAFGGSVEPLGFDRFKTCELMAELLHCSNMGLLNERGAEEEVRKRDIERENLKAAGKLTTPRAPSSPGHENSHEEFGSSVDSHGFHHAERPDTDDLNEAPEEIKKLEVQNASDEDGFEKVAPPTDELPEEVNFDDLNEKIDETGLPALEKVDKRQPEGLDVDVPRPLSPSKPKSPQKPLLHFDPPPTQAADSPTTAGVTDRISGLGMDEDTVMTEFGEESVDNYDDDGPTELERELAKAERPAPLFARKEAPAPDAVDPVHGTRSPDEIEEVEQSVATLQGESATLPNGERPAYETELDGSPVVGDLLKIRFVEHHVVPTILDFFFRFSWNNFLHNVVYDVVQQVFNGTLDRGYNRTLALDLFRPVELKDGQDAEAAGFVSIKDITDRVLDGQQASDESQKTRNMRLGYMGHLTLIAEEVCKFGNRLPPESLDAVVFERVGREEWSHYVEGVLAETRDKDNAVLGGVRPENAMQRPMSMGGGGGMQGGFSSNTANTLANAGIGSGMSAQDSLAMSEGTVGQSFEVNSGTILSGFGDGDDDDDDDEDMEDHDARDQERRGSAGSAFSEDEQQDSNDQSATTASTTTAEASGLGTGTGTGSLPPPLNIPPSRARRQLAARLAQRKQAAEAAETTDPDAADLSAVETAQTLPEEPNELESLAPATEHELREAGLRVQSGKGRFGGMFSSDEDSSDEELEIGGEGQDDDGPRFGRRPSTTEAKERRPLDDEDEAVEVARGGSSDDDDDDDEQLIEIKPRRTSQ